MNLFCRIMWGVGCVAVFTMAHAQEGTLPAGTIQKGSLANQQLIHDAKVGVFQKVTIMGCVRPGYVDTYVVAMPLGELGKRHWKERWIVDGCGKKYPVDIEFSEDGLNAANWWIRK